MKNSIKTTGVKGVVVSKETMDSYSPGDIAWLKKVYGGGSSSSAPISQYDFSEKIDLRQLGIIQNWPDNLNDAQVEQRVSQFLSTTPQSDIIQDTRLNSASECIMYPLVLNYKQVSIDPYDRVVSTPPSSYWPASMTQLNIWFDKGESSQHESIKKWLLSDLQPHIRMTLVFEKSSTGIVYTVISPAEMGTTTNPSNGQQNWTPAGRADSIGYRGNRIYTIKINSGRGVKKSTVLHEICHILGLYHSFDACKSGGECVKTDGDASIMSYVSPPDKGFSPVDIEWLRRVYGPPQNSTLKAPEYQLDTVVPQQVQQFYTLISLTIILILLVIIIFC